MQFLTEFAQYMPHGMCLLWQPWLVILWGGSDLLIFLAYFAIPIALLRVLLQRDDLNHRGLVLLFASFIMLCGITHAMSIVTLWIPIYPLQGLVKLATGLVSITTAVVLFRLVPALVAIPRAGELEDANRKLREEVAAHEQTLAVLRQARDELEIQVEERTAELTRVNAQLAITAREAVHRSRNLIAIVSSMARQSAKGKTRLDDFIETFVGRLTALADATAAVIRGGTRASASLRDIVHAQLEPVMLTYGDRITVEGPEVEIGSEAAQQISLALHELATNAQKYGALSSDDSKIEVSWAVTGAAVQGKRLQLQWKEQASGTAAKFVGDRGKKGFGTRLLTEIIPAILQGEASRKIDGGALIYQINVSMAAIATDHSADGNAALAAQIVDQSFAI